MQQVRSWLRKYAGLWRGRDKGTVAITFMLSLPILMSVIGVITQFALLANAKLAVDRAAAAAGRSAMTALPTDPSIDQMDGVSFVNKSARMALEGISPVAQDGASEEATDVANALKAVGLSVPDSYAGHYTYSEGATTVDWARVDANDQPISEPEWQPADFTRARGQRIKLTIHYKFFLSVPGIRTFIGSEDSVAGVSGRFMTMTSSVIVQLSPGREAQSSNTGWPY